MISNRFSAAAKTYDQHALPQLALAKSVVSILPDLQPERILELGAGTGQLTRLIAERFPDSCIDAVDNAEKMVEHSRSSFSGYPRINWIVDDAQTFQASSRYPLIISSAALHWVSDLPATFKNIYECLKPDGVFALGMMLHGTLKELRALRSDIAPQKNPTVSLPSFDEVQQSLQQAGFKIQKHMHNDQNMAYADAKSFLKAIHEQGVTGGKISAGKTPLSRSELSRLISDYQNTYSFPDGVYATYETATFLLTR